MSNMNYYKQGDSVIATVGKIFDAKEITKAEYDATLENIKSKEIEVGTNDGSSALNSFVSTLASSDTNSIAKIRAAAQQFLADTEGGEGV